MPYASTEYLIERSKREKEKRVALNSPPVFSFSPNLCVIGSAMQAAAVYVPDDAEVQSAQRPQRQPNGSPSASSASHRHQFPHMPSASTEYLIAQSKREKEKRVTPNSPPVLSFSPNL